MATDPAGRVHYFDMMKGVAIFMVVMGHVITFCVREIDRAAIYKFIGEIHMPLFFFVSGWFSFKDAGSGRPAAPHLGKRALQLLVPMMAVSSLWLWYFPHSGLESPLARTLGGLWADPWKNGYWFTLVLFEVILVYATMVPLLRRLHSLGGCVAVSLAVWMVLLTICAFLPASVNGWLSLGLAVTHFPAFMAGVLGHRYKVLFMSAVRSSWLQTAAMLVFAAMLYLRCWPWEFGLGGVAMMVAGAVLHISLIPIAVAVFEPWGARAFAPVASPSATLFPRLWKYIGKQSLAIYLLHYFFLFPMGSVFRPLLAGLNVGFVPLLVFSAFWAAAIIACVLGSVKLIAPSRQLSFILTGKLYNKT